MPKTKFLSQDQFRELAKAGDNIPNDIAVRTQFLPEIKAADDEESRQITFTVSTASIDRDRDTIAVDGWNLTNYRKNPVVLWAHDYRQPPIARTLEIEVVDDKLRAVTEFMGAELSKLADSIYRMVKGGWISATSVGFLPRKWVFAEDETRPYGIDFVEQELLEYSVVTVPSNSDALVEARSAGIDTAPLKEWVLNVLGSELTVHVKLDPSEVEAALVGALKKLGVPPPLLEPASLDNHISAVRSRQLQLLRSRSL